MIQRFATTLSALLTISIVASLPAQEPVAPKTEPKAHSISDVVRRAYLATYQGWSTDEVLLQDSLNSAFLNACARELPDARPAELNWTLLNARKAGKLKGTKVTKRKHDDHAAYQHLAEIVARHCQDKFKVTTDRIMCDAKMRSAFDAAAKELAPKTDPYLIRKAAFALRKARRLKPELVPRVADWGRKISSHSAAALQQNNEQIPSLPGVYIFRDSTGYLYIGEAVNLRKRLSDHLNQSDRQSLASYLKSNGVKDVVVELHVFPKNSRAKKVAVRRAYESELIASRKPRFNVRP